MPGDGTVHTVGDSRGLSIPEKVQLVLQRQGRLRVLAAAASAGVLRPLGHRGASYRLCGKAQSATSR